MKIIVNKTEKSSLVCGNRPGGIWDSLAAIDKLIQNNNKNSRLRNVYQYIFPTVRNTLHNKNSKYTISNIDYRRDVFLRMRVGKEIIKEKKMRRKI